MTKYHQPLCWGEAGVWTITRLFLSLYMYYTYKPNIHYIIIQLKHKNIQWLNPLTVPINLQSVFEWYVKLISSSFGRQRKCALKVVCPLRLCQHQRYTALVNLISTFILCVLLLSGPLSSNLFFVLPQNAHIRTTAPRLRYFNLLWKAEDTEQRCFFPSFHWSKDSFSPCPFVNFGLYESPANSF